MHDLHPNPAWYRSLCKKQYRSGLAASQIYTALPDSQTAMPRLAEL